jgi:hypothetical protein
LPTATAMPKPTPRICSSRPRSLPEDLAGLLASETASVEMDNVESQVISAAGAIIRSWGQKANHSAMVFTSGPESVQFDAT